MTETTTPTHPLPDPASLLFNLIVALLAPMFLAVSGGNPLYARLAAIETINGYRSQTQSDLITIAQIVAFGLAALGSLSLSMSDDLPVALILKLRATATACNRAAEQNRRVLQTNPRPAEPPPGPPVDEAGIIAGVTQVQQRAKQAQPPAPQPPKPEPPKSQTPAASPTTDQQYQAMWAGAAADVAAEFTAELANLPPQERRAAALKAEILTRCANDLLNSPPIPQIKPSELSAFIQRNDK